jgi:hypothetical protein
MSLWDTVGYVAAALVLAAFCMRDMVPLRIAALCSNVAFIAYGLALGLAPVWVLHALLLLMNGYRLLEALRAVAATEKRISDLERQTVSLPVGLHGKRWSRNPVHRT